MSVYKEALFIMGELGNKQTQIFDDACDYGIPIKDESCKELALVNQLKDMYFHETSGDSRKVDTFGDGWSTVTLKLTFQDEWGTGEKIPCIITYTRQPFKRTRHGAIKGVLSIDCKWAN